MHNVSAYEPSDLVGEETEIPLDVLAEIRTAEMAANMLGLNRTGQLVSRIPVDQLAKMSISFTAVRHPFERSASNEGRPYKLYITPSDFVSDWHRHIKTK